MYNLIVLKIVFELVSMLFYGQFLRSNVDVNFAATEAFASR
jgi:hypothetical protein